MSRISTPFIIAATLLLATVSVLGTGYTAQQDGEVAAIRFSGHHFTPQTLTVPAGRPLAIKVVNASNETIEFESLKLNRDDAGRNDQGSPARAESRQLRLLRRFPPGRA